MNARSPSSGPDTNRRRSQRVMLSMPVTVSGKTTEGTFSEQTQTMVINAHGALIALKAKVYKDQPVRIKTATSAEELECKVIWVGTMVEGKTQCGIEFVQPAPKFWGVSFPPSDWSPAVEAVVTESKKK